MFCVCGLYFYAICHADWPGRQTVDVRGERERERERSGSGRKEDKGTPTGFDRSGFFHPIILHFPFPQSERLQDAQRHPHHHLLSLPSIPPPRHGGHQGRGPQGSLPRRLRGGPFEHRRRVQEGLCQEKYVSRSKTTLSLLYNIVSYRIARTTKVMFRSTRMTYETKTAALPIPTRTTWGGGSNGVCAQNKPRCCPFRIPSGRFLP